MITFADALRVDNAAKLNFTDNSRFIIYCYSYNVLRIVSGMGGLAYSNWAHPCVKIHKNCILIYIHD